HALEVFPAAALIDRYRVDDVVEQPRLVLFAAEHVSGHAQTDEGDREHRKKCVVRDARRGDATPVLAETGDRPEGYLRRTSDKLGRLHTSNCSLPSTPAERARQRLRCDRNTAPYRTKVTSALATAAYRGHMATFGNLETTIPFLVELMDEHEVVHGLADRAIEAIGEDTNA